MELYVEIDTDRMRSAFTAIGLAWLFQKMPFAGSGVEVRLIDLGSAYRIDVPYERDQAFAYLAQRDQRLPPLIPAIVKKFSAGEQKELEADPNNPIQHKYQPQGFVGSVANYGEQQGYIAPKAAKKDSPRDENDTPQRSSDYPLWAHLSSYFGKGSAMRDGYPNLLHSWHAHQGDSAAALLDLILALYGDYPNGIEAAQAGWEREIQPMLVYTDYPIRATISALAVVSPSTSKGLYAETAARGLTENTPEAFWLPFYFAFAGYMVAGMPFTLGSDVALYYPLPQDISVERLQRVLENYRKQDNAGRLYQFSNLMPRIKLDVLAHIAYYRSMVKYFREQQEVDDWFSTLEAYGGFVGYYYKDAGGTQIPFDETVFALPRWLPSEAGRETLDDAYHLLEDHYTLIDRVRGKPPKNSMTSDELAVLDAYRQFITTGDDQAWIDFAVQYNRYRFGQMVDQPYLRDLTLDLFTNTLFNLQENDPMNDRKDYSPILQNPGFRNIASAIRHCTLTTRYLSDVKKINVGFKVRYGLGDDLLRQAHNPDGFMFELSTFLHDYARESSSVQANTGETRPFVTQDDLNEIAALIADYGSRTVASLLVAAGYSSDYNRPADSKS
jgi:hypothetical protein